VLLADTGVFLALADRRDAWHARVRSFLGRRQELLLAPATVLPEAAYMIRKWLGSSSELAFVRSVTNGELAVESLDSADYRRCEELMADYDQLGFVDASVVAVAERLNLARLLTTDRRHFSIVRPRHVGAFELVP
jgi:predicted nucleic acid-binding protein